MRNQSDSVALRNEYLLSRIKDIKGEHPFWGYRRVWAYLRYIDGLIVFTTPPLAAVGMNEEKAKQLSLRFKTNHGDTSGWYSSRRIGVKYSGFKVLVEEKSGRILGAHLLGLHAEEVINLFAISIRLGLRATDLKKMHYAYPTSSSDISYMI